MTETAMIERRTLTMVRRKFWHMTDGKRKLIGDLADADAAVRGRAMSGLGIGDQSDLTAFLIDCLSSVDREVGWGCQVVPLQGWGFGHGLPACGDDEQWQCDSQGASGLGSGRVAGRRGPGASPCRTR